MRSSLSRIRNTPSAHRLGSADGRNRSPRWLALVLALALIVPTLFFAEAVTPSGAQTISFVSTEVLGTPTDTSVRVNIIPSETVNMFFEYGTTSGVYTNQTPTLSAPGERGPRGPDHRAAARHALLLPDARTSIRAQPGVTEARPEQTFHTARAKGEPFTFTVTSDSHLGMLGDANRYIQDSNNIATEQPDFNIDTGDTFITDGLTTQAAVDQKYLNQRAFFDQYAGSTPVFLSPGNHEEEEGWNLDDTPARACSASRRARTSSRPRPPTASTRATPIRWPESVPTRTTRPATTCGRTTTASRGVTRCSSSSTSSSTRRSSRTRVRSPGSRTTRR